MKRIPVITIFILVVFSKITGQDDDSLKFKSLAPYDFPLEYLKTDTALLIDVREFFEYKKKRIKGAVNIPSSGNLRFAADTIDKERALFIYCTSGFRSKRSSREFYDLGFHNLYNLDGGISAWKKDGYPVERKRLRKRK
ncbi:MAG: rhodanese-like domain-containing protein [Bacteroidia bacterium]|nr:MAG: rhodanese-like domain-containing protein [Bacteroidia bacterium]